MKLTRKNYHSAEANQEYMSNSQFGDFLKCEAMAMAKLSGKWRVEPSKSMLEGSYVHAWSEGEESLNEFKSEHPEIFKKDGSLLSTFEHCNKVIEVIKNDPLFMRCLSGKREQIFTAEMFGVKWRVLIDSILEEENRFMDLKILKDIYEKSWNKELNIWQSIFEVRGYFRQIALYAAIHKLSTGRSTYMEPFIGVATKEEYPDKAIVSFATVTEEQRKNGVSSGITYTEFIDQELMYIESNIQRVIDVKTMKEKPIRCEHCDYCRSTKALTGTIHYSHLLPYGS